MVIQVDRHHQCRQTQMIIIIVIEKILTLTIIIIATELKVIQKIIITVTELMLHNKVVDNMDKTYETPSQGNCGYGIV